MCIIAGFTTKNAPEPTAQRTEISGIDVATGVAGVVAAMLMLIVSRWPIAALGVGILVGMAVNTLARPRTTSKIAEARLDALAAWCEQLRDLLRAGALADPGHLGHVADMPTRDPTVRHTTRRTHGTRELSDRVASLRR